jgi:protoporphyrinogen oxidase
MLAGGDTTLPAQGMGAIPAQLADRLPAGVIQFRSRVARVARIGDEFWIILANGDRLSADVVVVATEGAVASRLTGAFPAPEPRAVTCLYFAAEKAPLEEPLLVLDGDGRGPVTTLCVPSRVAPAYAPPGAHLISAAVLGNPAETDEVLEAAVREQLGGWFGGSEVASWRHLRTYRIPLALFDQRPGVLEPASRPVRLQPGLYVCGDHVENASINGAMAAGRRAAEAVVVDLKGAVPRCSSFIRRSSTTGHSAPDPEQ